MAPASKLCGYYPDAACTCYKKIRFLHPTKRPIGNDLRSLLKLCDVFVERREDLKFWLRSHGDGVAGVEDDGIAAHAHIQDTVQSVRDQQSDVLTRLQSEATDAQRQLNQGSHFVSSC